MQRVLKSWLLFALLLGTTAYVIAEDLTLTTYYPSPRGVYNELRTQGDVKIGDITSDPTTARLLVVGQTGAKALQVQVPVAGTPTDALVITDSGSVGIGTPTPAPGVKLHIVGPTFAQGPTWLLDTGVFGNLYVGGYTIMDNSLVLLQGGIKFPDQSVLTSANILPHCDLGKFLQMTSTGWSCGTTGLDTPLPTGGMGGCTITSGTSGPSIQYVFSGPSVIGMTGGSGSTPPTCQGWGAGASCVAQMSSTPLPTYCPTNDPDLVPNCVPNSTLTGYTCGCETGYTPYGTNACISTATSSASQVLSVDADGNLTVSGDVTVNGSVFASSDARFKTDLQPLTGALEKLDSLHGISFERSELAAQLGQPNPGKRELGLIAQELETVYPELVTARGEEQYRVVDYSRLSVVLLEAIKELKADQARLNQRLMELEAHHGKR